MLNFFMSWSLNQSNVSRLFDLKLNSFTYTPIMMSFSSYLRIRIYVSALVEVKPIF